MHQRGGRCSRAGLPAYKQSMVFEKLNTTERSELVLETSLEDRETFNGHLLSD